MLRPATAARSLGDLADSAGLRVIDADRDVQVSGITLDSRAVQPGDLFAALPGANAHGAQFCDEARSRGAVAVLTDEVAETAGLPAVRCADPRYALGDLAAEIFGRPSDELLMVGITGTNGKTTTAFLVEAGLRAAGYATGVIGTTGVRLGDTALPSARTTPEAPDLHALLGVMRERGIDAVAMEVSSHALALGRVDGIVFDMAVFTNLSQDHLDFHGTMEAYFEAKASLFTPRRARQAVIWVGDGWGARLARTTTLPVTTFALDHEADARCTAIVDDLGEQSMTVLCDGESHEVVVGIPGRFNAANGLAAWTALHVLGLPDGALSTAMRDVRVPGRMELVDEGQDFVAVVDYAHSPDSVERVVASVEPDANGRRIVVLGCGGDRDREKRPVMGRIAAEWADILFVTDDNPRSEDPASIRAAMLAGITAPRGDVREIGDRRAAISAAVGEAHSGDVVLILGKGHEPGQEVAGVVHPFSDREELSMALRST
ncbi:MAG: UDP-N-acetylmuramoyl-L-alanyl-D-glutamate--2,6-diaminopimelate ligase [Actinomycetota bacterium]